MKYLYIVISIICFIFVGLKINRFNEIKNNFSKINPFVLGEMNEHYFLLNNEYPSSADDFNVFLKGQNINLYNQLNSVNYYIKHKPVRFFSKGFNNKIDNASIEINSIGFLDSFFSKGDFYIDMVGGIKITTNRLYFLTNKKFKMMSSSSIHVYGDIVTNKLNCDRAYLNNLDIINKENSRIRIENGKVNVLYNTFDKESVYEIKKYLKNIDSKNKTLLIHLSGYNIKDYACGEAVNALDNIGNG